MRPRWPRRFCVDCKNIVSEDEYALMLQEAGLSPESIAKKRAAGSLFSRSASRICLIDRDLIDGSRITRTCEEMRAVDGLCGIDAVLFEPKE